MFLTNIYSLFHFIFYKLLSPDNIFLFGGLSLIIFVFLTSNLKHRPINECVTITFFAYPLYFIGGMTACFVLWTTVAGFVALSLCVKRYEHEFIVSFVMNIVATSVLITLFLLSVCYLIHKITKHNTR